MIKRISLETTVFMGIRSKKNLSELKLKKQLTLEICSLDFFSEFYTCVLKSLLDFISYIQMSWTFFSIPVPYSSNLKFFHHSYFSDNVCYLFSYPKVALGNIFFLTYCIQSNIFLAAREAEKLAAFGLDQDLTNAFRKGPNSKYLRLFRPYVLCCSYSDLSLESESSYRQ